METSHDINWYVLVFSSTVQAGVPIKDGSLTTIEVHRRRDEELGISFVGGNETPMVRRILTSTAKNGILCGHEKFISVDDLQCIRNVQFTSLKGV